MTDTLSAPLKTCVRCGHSGPPAEFFEPDCRNLCNKGLGHFMEDPDRMKRAIQYVEVHRA